jgi:GGDEF domain-containing protein
MGATFTGRLGRMGYQRARLLLVVTGLVVLALVVLVMFVRRVDGVEVAATLLFVPIFLAFTFRGVVGGLLAAVAAVVAYVALRYPAVEAVGWAHFTGLITSRAAAYLIFGAVGGWSSQVLESSLGKLDLYDEVDDETGLYNARHLLRLTDLEVARAQRYRTLFSVAVLELPRAAVDTLSPRRSRALLRELGTQLAEAARTVDHVAHARDERSHLFVVVLPETAPEGAEVFRHRFAVRVLQFLAERGVQVTPAEVVTRTLTFPGDEDRLGQLRYELSLVDAAEHRTPLPS